ncbi:MAG: TrpB-like pyridoxal phosphate-dependent enzyme [Nitrospirota bacterium]|nr:TrpB-like pyridoxal phosphate-dependent enzyme [Nitrospirota bacterium]
MLNRNITMSSLDIPRRWYNVRADLPEKVPPSMDPEGEDSRIQKIRAITPKSLQDQDATEERWIDIPDEVLEKYIITGRPTPLYRAVDLEKYLETPARIYFKREDMMCSGSFKPNTSIAQAYYVKKEGYTGTVTQTGAGQWGTAIALASSFYGLQCRVFIPVVSYHHKPFRRIHAELLGAEFLPSPSPLTKSGRKLLAQFPDHPGSVNSGISDALEFAMENEGFTYLNGSNAVHTLLHNTIIGLETKKQLESAGERADMLIACIGGGSNLGGFMMPFIKERLANQLRFLAIESTAAPRLTKGEYRYEHGDPGKLTPLNKTYTLGHDFIPPVMHVGGLRQHGGSPLVSLLRHLGYIEPIAYDQKDTFEAGRLFSHIEGILPAPETCHAIKAVIDEANIAKKEKKERVIVACLSGNGYLDLEGYRAVLLDQTTVN